MSPAEVDAMVRSLLVTRFKMTSAKETRDLPVYHLGRRAKQLAFDYELEFTPETTPEEN